MFTKSAFSVAALRLAMAPHAGIATFFGMHPAVTAPGATTCRPDWSCISLPDLAHREHGVPAP